MAKSKTSLVKMFKRNSKYGCPKGSSKSPNGKKCMVKSGTKFTRKPSKGKVPKGSKKVKGYPRLSRH